VQNSTFCEYCAMKVAYQAVSKVRERSPSLTLLQLLAHNPRLTAEWFVGSSNMACATYLETSQRLAGTASRRMQARCVHLWRIDCGCHPDTYPKMRGEIITWSPQKHVYSSKQTIDQERPQELGGSRGLTRLESLDNDQVKHPQTFVVCVVRTRRL
jgi:hypothetical protein